MARDNQKPLSMALLSLPNELLEIIAENLTHPKDINGFTKANRRLYHLLNPFLYRQDAREGKLSYLKSSPLKSRALFWAGYTGQEATARDSLAQGGDVQAKNEEDQTPLLVAAEYGRLGLVKLLLEEGADVNQCEAAYINEGESSFYHEYQTPLILAANNGHVELLKLLSDHPDIDVGGDTLLRAAEEGQAETIKLLLAHKHIEPNHYYWSCGTTALSIAAKEGHLAAVEALLACPAVYVDAKSIPEWLESLWWQGGPVCTKTPLQLTVVGGHNVIVELLLTREEIDIDGKGQFKCTARDLARNKGKRRAEELLLAHKAKNGQGRG